jgi:DNA-binding PucR family transcriptional regulator
VRRPSSFSSTPKTLRYRLEQIRTLAKLDLSKHSDRVRAALALQLLEVTRSVG